MAKRIWRVNFDISATETDPTVTVYVGKVETDDDTGAVTVRQDTRWPVVKKLSEITKSDLTDHTKMKNAQDAVRTAAQVPVVP